MCCLVDCLVRLPTHNTAGKPSPQGSAEWQYKINRPWVLHGLETKTGLANAVHAMVSSGRTASSSAVHCFLTRHYGRKARELRGRGGGVPGHAV